MEGKYYEDVKRTPIMAALLIASFFSYLGETLLNVALPRFMTHFNISANKAGWLITCYLLVIGICVPAAAYLIRKFRTRVLFIASLTLFLIGLTICATAQNFPMLLTGRVVQGLGAAIIIPLNMTVILAITPPEKRGTANGFFILVLMFAPSVGPTLSGIILEHCSWRALFWLIIPFLVFALIISIIFMRDVTKTSKPKFDSLSMLLSVFGFGFTIYALSIAATVGVRFWIFLIIGLSSLTSFVIRQIKLPYPMLDFRVFKHKNFKYAAIFMVMSVLALFSNVMMMPMFLQKVLGVSTFITGLTMMPGGLAEGAISPIIGKFYDKYGGNYLVIIGFFMIGGTLFYFSHLSINSKLMEIIAVLIILGISIPFVLASSQTSALNSLPPKLYSHGSAVLSTLFQVAASLGASISLTIMSTAERRYAVINNLSSLQTPEAILVGIRLVYNIGFMLIIPMFIVTIVLFIKKHKI